MTWEMVVGLETHVELSTKTKIFCSCTTQFGGEPNTHCCPICTGQPGSLPVLNKSAVEYAAMAGLALNCRVNRRSVMARKHYFYPDLPKAYQISQYERPLCEDGWMDLSGGRRIRIRRIHIEEDAGKLVHQGGAALIDYNRGGVPLIEIVTEPDFRSAAEASEYLEKLQTTLRAIGVSDCRMQEGSLRCDVNVSVRKKGDIAFGVRTEVKNLNSFASVAAAIEYEFERQVEILEAGGRVVQETRHFDAETGETKNLRGKENADDYRYFPEPDILPVVVPDELVERLKARMPELPEAKASRYVLEFGLSEADARMLTKYRKVSEYFERSSQRCGSPKTVAAFMITQMFSQIQTEVERENWAPLVSAEDLGDLVSLVESGRLSRNVAKRVFARMMETGRPAGDFITPEDMSEVSADSLLELCRTAIEENRKSADDFKAGKEKAMKALVGAVMRASRGRADAIEAERLLREMLK